jgi:hypothetical protein
MYEYAEAKVKLDFIQRMMQGKLTEDEKLELDALDMLEKLQNGDELSTKQQKALLDLLKKALKESGK